MKFLFIACVLLYAEYISDNLKTQNYVQALINLLIMFLMIGVYLWSNDVQIQPYTTKKG